MAFALDKTCTLCCQEATAWAVGSCDHLLCLTCSARMRVLCEQKECPVCREQNEQVAVVKKPISFSAISVKNCIANRYGFLFSQPYLQKVFQSITALSCSLCEQWVVFSQIRQLEDHVRKVHDRFFCDICLDNLKLFPSEHKLYTRQQLAKHRRDGDPGDNSHKGHPLCHFCDERFLDKDTLFFHLKDNHFWCHICEADGKQDYYANYSELHKHFKVAHYMCEEGQCRYEKLSTVFRTKLDYQAHKAKVHTLGLTKAETKQLRQIEVQFQFSREQSGDGMPPVSRRQATGRRHRGAQLREQDDMSLATAMSLSTIRPTSHEKENQSKSQDLPRRPISHEKENQSKSQDLPRRPTSHEKENQSKSQDLPSETKVAESDNVQVPNIQLQPPPGLKLSRHEPASCAWPDLSPNVGKPCVGNPMSSFAPPPPGFIVPKPPPGYSLSVNRSNPSTKRQEINIIEQARAILDEQKFLEFRHLSGSYAKGTISARRYYSSCSGLFGDTWFVIGPKLAETLPLPHQREELLTLFKSKQELTTFGYSSTRNSRKAKQKKPWQGTSNGGLKLNEEDYPSLSDSARQPDPTVPLPGWNTKIFVK